MAKCKGGCHVVGINRAGLVQRLYVLDYGLFQVHSNQRIIGIPGYLIQTLDDVDILVDTGFPARYVDDPDGIARKIPVQSPA